MEKLKNFFFKNTSTKQTVAKNTVWLVFGEMTARLLRFALIIYAARTLGTDGWGVFSYALSAAGIYMIFSDFGLSPLLIKERVIKTDNKNEFLSAIFNLKIALIIISLVAGVLLEYTTHSKGSNYVIVLLALLLLVSDSIREFAIGLIRAQEKMEREAFFRIFTNICIFLLGVILLIKHPTADKLALAYLTGSLIGTIAVLATIGKEILSFLSPVSKKVYIAISGIIWPVALLGVSNSLMVNIDTVMLHWWSSIHEVGLYAADQRVVQFLYIIPTFFITALYPRLAQLKTTSASAFKKIFTESIGYIYVITIPLGIITALFSKEIITILFGYSYVGGATTLAILTATIIFIFPTMLLYNTAILLDKQKSIAWITVLGVIVLIISNYILIPHYGIIGVAISMVISQAIIMILTSINMRNIFKSYEF